MYFSYYIIFYINTYYVLSYPELKSLRTKNKRVKVTAHHVHVHSTSPPPVLWLCERDEKFGHPFMMQGGYM